MRPVSRSTVFIICIMLVLLIVCSVAAQHDRLPARLWFNVSQLWQPVEPDAIKLGEYHVVLQGMEIKGIEDDASSLTFDPIRQTLFTVTNKDAELFELSLDGRILRRIKLIGFGDAEAVEFVGENTYVIADEREHRLFKVKVDDNTRGLDARDAEQLTLGLHKPSNKGFEGLAYDPVGKRMFVAKERDPMLIYEVRGFPWTIPGNRLPFMWRLIHNGMRACLYGICRIWSMTSAPGIYWHCRTSRNCCLSWAWTESRSAHCR